MSDIFDEVSAELRRDNLQAAWDKYARYLIGAAVGLVVLVAGYVGTTTVIDQRNASASARYDVMLTTLAEDDGAANITTLMAFATAEDNGYGALARFSAALEQARRGDNAAALENFEIVADNGGLPDTMRDLAALQAAVVMLDREGDLVKIESRLRDLLDAGNGLQAMARETLALAYMANDLPLKARELFRAQLNDPTATSLTRERAAIMLQSVSGSLVDIPAPSQDTADEKAKGE